MVGVLGLAQGSWSCSVRWPGPVDGGCSPACSSQTRSSGFSPSPWRWGWRTPWRSRRWPLRSRAGCGCRSFSWEREASTCALSSGRRVAPRIFTAQVAGAMAATGCASLLVAGFPWLLASTSREPIERRDGGAVGGVGVLSLARAGARLRSQAAHPSFVPRAPLACCRARRAHLARVLAGRRSCWPWAPTSPGLASCASRSGPASTSKAGRRQRWCSAPMLLSMATVSSLALLAVDAHRSVVGSWVLARCCHHCWCSRCPLSRTAACFVAAVIGPIAALAWHAHAAAGPAPAQCTQGKVGPCDSPPGVRLVPRLLHLTQRHRGPVGQPSPCHCETLAGQTRRRARRARCRLRATAAPRWPSADAARPSSGVSLPPTCTRRLSRSLSQAVHGRVEFVHAGVESLDYREAFDLVILDNVYEHLPDHDAALAAIWRAMRPGAVLYVLVPNKLWPVEAHYDLPFLSWLPLPLANRYLRLTRRGNSYEDASYAPTYWGLKTAMSKHGSEVPLRAPCRSGSDGGRYPVALPPRDGAAASRSRRCGASRRRCSWSRLKPRGS